MASNEKNDILEKSDTEKLENIRKFLLDIDCLDKLKEWQYGANFFEVSGMINKEVKHSKVLSWILDANGSHGLGDKIIKKFLQQIIVQSGNIIGEGNVNDIIDVSLMDFSSFIVKTEYKNIDIFLVSEKEKAVILIENKVYASERIGGDYGGQLNKYLTIIGNEYSEYKKMPIFLTREGEEPSDTDKWYVANYSMIVNIIDNVIKYSPEMQTDTKIILEHYIKMVRRNLIVNKDLQQICAEIYYKHRGALDLIYDNRPDNITTISEYVQTYLKQHAKEYGIIIESDSCNKTFVRFVTTYIAEILPKEQNGDYGLKNGWRFMYEIKIEDNGAYAFGNTYQSEDVICHKLFEIGQDNYAKFGIKRKSKESSGGNRIINFKRILEKIDIENDFSEIQERLNKMLTTILTIDIPEFEMVLKDKFSCR